MRWQRLAQAAIALFVIGFVVMLAMSLRRQQAGPPPQPPPERKVPDAAVETPDRGTQVATDPTGKRQWEVKFGSHVMLADGRSQLDGGVEATINRGDRQFVLTSRTAEITAGTAGEPVKVGVFKGDVRVTGAGGLEVKTSEATYTHADGMVTIPGPVEFAKGRLTGSGVGATYDQNRDVFWVKDKARVQVAPAEAGKGALEATARAIGLARREHYILLQGDARIMAEAREARGNDITVRLTDDDERIRLLELRGNSSIAGGSGGPQTMSASDIDMTYAEDGRTLQHARLVENAVVQMAGTGSAPGNRISGSAIDIGLGPDGSTVTMLSATEPVQVDLPAEGQAPAKTIRSKALTANGAAGTGLQNATFSGGAEYRETRPAIRGAAPVDRTATSETLVVETKPGLGAIQKADFRGNVKFTDAPDFTGEAQQGIYHIARDRLELMAAPGQPGPESPTVTDGKVSVAARTIQFALSTREMTAETSVRSTIQPEKKRAGRGRAQSKLPSMLAQDEPVNVTANRLNYKGAGSAAEYSGNVILWQGRDTTIKAPTISIDDKNGNLTASGNAVTTFAFEETDPKTGKRTREITTGTAETFTYVDATRLATYTGKAHIQGAQGDVTGEKIELFMKAGVNELERAEAYGANGNVQVREGKRIAKGSHLTYTAGNDLYLMIGTPVEVIEEKNGTCTLTKGSTVTFNRTTERAQVDGLASGGIPMKTETLKACPAELAR